MARLGRAFPNPRKWIRPVASTDATTYPSTPSGSTTPTGTLLKSVTHLAAGSTTPTGSELHLVTHLAAGTTTPAGTALKQATHLAAGSSTPAGAVAKRTNHLAAGSTTPSGVISTITARYRALTGSITPAGTALKQANHLAAGSSTPSGTALKQTNHLAAGSTTPSGTALKRMGKVLTGSSTPSGTFSTITARARTLAGSITPVGAILKQTAHLVAGSSTPSGTVKHSAVTKLLSGASSPAATVAKAPRKVLAGSSAVSGALTGYAARVKALVGSLTPSGVSVKRPRKIAAGSTTPTGTTGHGFILKRLSGAIAVAANLFGIPFTRKYGRAGTVALLVSTDEVILMTYQRQRVTIEAYTVADALLGNQWERDATGAPQRAATTPGSPSEVTATPGNTQATVFFSAPADDGGSPILDYTATASTGQFATSTTSPIVVPGLANGVTVAFIVTARNLLGDSIPSDASAPVTPVAGVPEPPTAVLATPGNGSVLVQWSAPTNNGGSPIIGYTVNLSTGAVLTPTSSPVTFSGLTNGTAVTATVSARNAIGSSQPSARTSPVTPATTPGAPTITGLVAGAGQITVQWSAPATTGGSPVIDYTVIAYSGTGSTVVQTLTGASGTSLAVTGLTNGSSYSFTVAARNSVGTGTASTRSSTATPAGTTITVGTSTSKIAVGAQSVALDKPTGTVSGNLLVATLTLEGTSPVTSVPTGWVLVGKSDIGSVAHVYAYYKVAGSSEPSTYTWSWTGDPSGVGGGIQRYIGVNTTTPLDGAAVLASDPSTSATSISGSITTTSAAGMVVASIGAYSTSISFTPPTGWSEDYDVHGTDGRVNSQAHYAVTGVSSGTYKWTASSGRALGLVLFALRH